MDLKETEILLPSQKRWIEDTSQLKIWEKTRRYGASWTEALNSVFHAAPQSGQNTYYMSYNKDMTRGFIQDCIHWAKVLKVACDDLEEILINNEGKDITVYRVRFASGCEILGMPSSAYLIRGKQGRIVLDEAAFSPEFDEIMKAALALLIWGGSFSVISTHNGDDNPFNLLIKRVREGKEKRWNIHRITFRDAVAEGLYKRICLLKKKEWTETEEVKWVNEIRDIYKDNGEEELDVIPKKAGTKYFPYGMLSTCTSSAVEIIRLNCRDEFMWERPEARLKKISKWFKTDVAPLLRAIDGPVFMGMDFARSGNLSFLWVAEEVARKDLNTRICIELWNVPYDQQWQILCLISETCSLEGLALDGRGNGQALAEAVAQRLPCWVEMVMPTRAFYAASFPPLKSAIESRDFILPDDEFILSDFGIITVKNGTPIVPDTQTRDRPGEGKGKRHGDGAVAAALCHYAWREGSSCAPPEVAVTASDIDTLFFGY
jgi:phage FluMu gp28-like protein